MLITLLTCYTGRQEKCNFIWQLFISIVYISTVNSKILTILCSRHARKIALFQGFIPLKKGHSHKLHITVTFLVSSGLQMTMMKQSIDVFFFIRVFSGLLMTSKHSSLSSSLWKSPAEADAIMYVKNIT